MAEAARRYKGAWLDGQEPPAPLVPKPRPKKAPKPRPVVPASDKQRDLIAALAVDLEEVKEARELCEEAGATVGAELGKEAAGNLIDRMHAAIVEAHDRAAQERLVASRHVGEVGELASVAGAVALAGVI